MKKLHLIILVIILMLISIFTINSYNSSNHSNVINKNVIKIKAIDFKLKDLEGNEFSLSDLRGKKVFLNFWATWCPPCRGEMPEMEKLYAETKDSDLVILAVDIGEPLSKVAPFISNSRYNFKVLLDPDQSVASKYKISSIPTSYFIDINGDIISKHEGSMNIDQMKEYIKTLDY